MGWTSRIADVRNASSASASAVTGMSRSSIVEPAPLDEQAPGDAGQAAGAERRRHQPAVDGQEHVGAAAFAQLAGGVGEYRLARAVAPGLGQGQHVLGV